MPLFACSLLLITAGLLGCGDIDHRPEAIGPEGQLTIVVDSARWSGPVGEALRTYLGTYILTMPTPEQAFDLRHMSMTSTGQFEQIKRQKNIVFAAPLTDTTNEARFLQSLFSEEARQAILEGRSAVVSRTNVWRRSQQVFYVTAASPEELVATLEEDAEAIRDTFNVITRQRVYQDMFDRGRQPALEERLMERHGFAVNAQHDYLIAIDTTDFVWMRRILTETERSLFVHYEANADPAELSAGWVYTTRDSLSRQYLQGSLGCWVEIDRRRPIETKEINFLGRYGFETWGLWQFVTEVNGRMAQCGGGGPFLTYSFYDQDSGRLYMIDGMIFAPNFNKREFLRQMEVIAHSFRTRQDLARSNQIAAASLHHPPLP